MDSRPLLTSMDDDYAAYAVSQRMSFEHAFPAILQAALDRDGAPVLRVLDQGAADGANSHLLIRVLRAMRAGRPLVYSLVDMPTNGWNVAAAHLGAHEDLLDVVVVPSPGDPRATDVGSGAHAASAGAHADMVDDALAAGADTVIGMAGIPLHTAPGAPDGTIDLAVTGTTMHWVDAPAQLGCTGSVFPGYAEHRDLGQRAEWRERAAAQWADLLHMRARELAPGGWFIAALPASERAGTERTGLYGEVVLDMNAILREWVAGGVIAQSTADAVVTPVWMRTIDEIRAPFERAGGDVDGLRLQRLELFRLDNPYAHDDPHEFARRFVRSCVAWGGPLLLGAFRREGDERAPELLREFVRELEIRVAADADRHRWDYVEALVVCRKDLT